MPSERDAEYLTDILDNLEFVLGLIEGMSWQAFRDDRRTNYAVARALEIVSEASRRLSASLKERNAGIPWRGIAGLGNVYRHEYGRVDLEAVWTTARTDVPEFLAVVRAELERLNRSDTSPS